MATPSFHLFRPKTLVSSLSPLILSHPYAICLESVGSTFKIHPESDQFSPPSLLAPWITSTFVHPRFSLNPAASFESESDHISPLLRTLQWLPTQSKNWSPYSGYKALTVNAPNSPSPFFPLLTHFHPHWPPCCSLNTSDFCTGSFLCLEHSSSRYLHSALPYFLQVTALKLPL